VPLSRNLEEALYKHSITHIEPANGLPSKLCTQAYKQEKKAHQVQAAVLSVSLFYQSIHWTVRPQCLSLVIALAFQMKRLAPELLSQVVALMGQCSCHSSNCTGQ